MRPPGTTPARSGGPGTSRSLPGSARGSCDRKSAGPVPAPTACSGRGHAAFGGTSSLQLLRDLVLRPDAIVTGHVADDLLARDVALIPGLALARVLAWRGGVRIGIGVQEIRVRVPDWISLVAGLV